MAKREFLQLAHVYDETRYSVNGWYWSEKLDGMRCYWDGGITRGRTKRAILWANDDKDERYRAAPICTGLWSRLGNVIHAPSWWLNTLPPYPLDGELYIKVGSRSLLMSIIKDIEPTASWNFVKYHVFDSPSYSTIFAPGKLPWGKDATLFFHSVTSDLNNPDPSRPFFLTYQSLLNKLGGHQFIKVCQQTSINSGHDLEKLCDNICLYGGEGLMFRHPDYPYKCIRSHHLLKMKKLKHGTGTVVGHEPGKGKYHGMMGSVMVTSAGVTFSISGFTDAERVSATTLFPVGSEIKFKYRDVSEYGVPVEARYDRI